MQSNLKIYPIKLRVSCSVYISNIYLIKNGRINLGNLKKYSTKDKKG